MGNLIPFGDARENASRKSKARRETNAADQSNPQLFRRDGKIFFQVCEGSQPLMLCGGSFEVVARVYALAGKKRSRLRLLVKFVNVWGQDQQFELPWSGRQMLSDLEDAGLEMADERELRKKLVQYIRSQNPQRLIRKVREPGWHGDCYVGHFGATFGDTKGEEIELDEDSPCGGYICCGTLDGWRTTIGDASRGNPLLIFDISTAFTSLIQRPLDLETVGFHFVARRRPGFDPSSIGKTTRMHVARSITGGPKETWNMTKNAVEEAAVRSNDSLLVLDEIGEADAKTIGTVVYMLSDNTGRGRFGQRRNRWVTTFLSTGEITLEEKMAEAKQTTKTGQRVRSINLNADAGANLGCWTTIHDFPDGSTFANFLTRSAKENMGVTGEEFLRQFVSDIAEHVRTLKEYSDATQARWRAELNLDLAQGVVSRVMKEFTIRAAVGELARVFGFVPWIEGEATEACRKLFAGWYADYLQTHPSAGRPAADPEAGIRQVLAFLRREQARFQVRERGSAPVDRRLGFIKRTREGVIYYIEREAFRREVAEGLIAEAVARELAARGYLQRDKDGRLTKKTNRLAEPGTDNFYVILIRE